MDDLKKFEPLWGNWYIAEKLGEGSFGKVYKIERKEFGNTYTAAMKHIRVPQSESEVKSILADGMTMESVETYFEGFVENIVGEFVLMSKLKGDSHIVSYEDHTVIKDDDGIGWDIFIRMELLTGLLDYIQNNDITKRDIIKLGIDMCKALELCQKYNIIHRDIKPENIFISKSGKFKLGDFGIAREIEQTMAGLSKKGTFTYIAPEVYKGEAYGSNVDIYSLGIVMYRLLNNNRVPFMPPYPQIITHTDREMALVKRISGQPLEKPVNADGRLAEIVLKACAYNPAERYHSPQMMRMDLEAILYNDTEKSIIYPDGDNAEQKSLHYSESASVKPKDEIMPDKEETRAMPAFAEETAETKTMFMPDGEIEETDETKTMFMPAEETDETKTMFMPVDETAGNTETGADKPKTNFTEADSIQADASLPDNQNISSQPQFYNDIESENVFSDSSIIGSNIKSEKIFSDKNEKEILGKSSYEYDENAKKIKQKKIILIIAAVVILLLLLKACAGAEDDAASSASYQENTEEVTEEINIDDYMKDGVITISNDEEMSKLSGADFSSDIKEKCTSIVMEDGVISIPDGAFEGYCNVTSVTIPNGVLRIGSYAFNYCTGLKTITLPASLVTIDNNAFCDCHALESVYFAGANLRRIGAYAFDNNNALTEIVIPDGVEAIGTDAFSGCRKLNSIVIPDSVTDCEISFKYCSALQNVYIGSNVSTIAQYGFNSCKSLTELTIPANITEIGRGTFDGCTSLKTIKCSRGSAADDISLYPDGVTLTYID